MYFTGDQKIGLFQTIQIISNLNVGTIEDIKFSQREKFLNSFI